MKKIVYLQLIIFSIAIGFAGLMVYNIVEGNEKERIDAEGRLTFSVIDNIADVIKSAARTNQPSGMTIPITGIWIIDTNANTIYLNKTYQKGGIFPKTISISYKMELTDVNLSAYNTVVNNAKVLNAFPQPDGTVLAYFVD